MSRQQDTRRARAALQLELAQQSSLEQAGEASENPQLRSLLEELGRRKAGQSARLRAWLDNTGNSDPGWRPAAEAGAGDTRRDSASVPAASTPAFSDSGEVAVTEHRQVTNDLIIFKLERPPGYGFKPGQSVKLGLGGVERRYSIVSAPHEPFLEFFIELAPGGRMSEHLRALKSGDSVRLVAPKGSFLLDERCSHHLMIATVTGINPFISMLRDAFHQGRHEHRFTVLQGASYQDELGYRDELTDLAAANPQILTYIPTVSRPDEARNAAWTGTRGRVGAIAAPYLDQAVRQRSSTAVYACGNPEMVREIEERGRAHGLRVITEPYD